MSNDWMAVVVVVVVVVVAIIRNWSIYNNLQCCVRCISAVESSVMFVSTNVYLITLFTNWVIFAVWQCCLDV